MTIVHALLLGILQGLTEFIPVSSTAHLLVGEHFLGLDPHDPTLFSFSVLIQLGTLVSLFIFYWKDLLKLLGAALRFVPTLTRPRSAWSLTPDTWLGFYIILATIPALLAGYLLKDAVEALFRYPLLEAAIRFFAAAILLSLAERLASKNRKLDSMTWLDALFIGLFQVIAIFPGASRSGTTISGGMFQGFDRPSAARFAFLMSAPVMLAAGAYEILDVIQMPNLGGFLSMLAVGFISAALVGWLAIRWLIGYLGKGSLYTFAIYCALAGTATLFIYLFPIGF